MSLISCYTCGCVCVDGWEPGDTSAVARADAAAERCTARTDAATERCTASTASARVDEFQGQMQAQHGEVQNLTATINNMAQGFQATQAAINQLLANQVGQPAVAPAVPIPEPPIAVEVSVQNHNGNHYTLEKFIKNGAKVFTGIADPEKAEAWTLNMLKSFRAMEVPEAHWVRLASCMFEEAAAFWWDSAQRSSFVGREFNSISWGEFMDVFNVKYYPEQIREQKSREFSNLKQEEMTVRDYEQKFIQLERFALGLCSTEKSHANKFLWGLRFALKDRVVNQRPQTLAQAVEIACLSEEVLNEQFGSLQRKDKGKGASDSGSGNNNNSKGVVNRTQSSPKAERASGKRKAEGDQQGGRDKLTQVLCCGQLGHFKKDCR